MDAELEILVKHLPALQALGVTALKVGGLEVALRPVQQHEEPAQPQEPQARDPMAYGLPPGTRMPSLRPPRHG